MSFGMMDFKIENLNITENVKRRNFTASYNIFTSLSFPLVAKLWKPSCSGNINLPKADNADRTGNMDVLIVLFVEAAAKAEWD
jgi:hypothetical protein